MYIDNYKVYSSLLCIEPDGFRKIPKTFKEKYFSLPWRPLCNYKLEPKSKPSNKITFDKINMIAYVHPILFEEMRKHYGN